MPDTGLRKKMIGNTIANYVKVVINFIIAIFLTRTLFMGLSHTHYGMWALLWTIFGYSVLLDFGFGTAVQKSTSEVLVNENWDWYNRLVSTVFFNYLLLAVGLAGITVLLSLNMESIFQLEENVNLEYMRKTLLIFGIGSSLVFPLGVTMEILLGLNEIKLRNMITIVVSIVNFIMLFTLVKLGYSIMRMAIATIGLNLIASIVQAYFCFKKIPQLRVNLKLYDWSLMKDVMSFSFFAYIIIFTNMIIFRTDQITISIFGSVSLVAIYQIASKLAENFKKFTTQFLDNLRPVAATLFESKQDKKLAKILIESNRLQGFIATMIIIPLLIYIEPLLEIWLELSNPAGIASALILLFSMYIYVFFRSSSVYVLLMGDRHRKLAKVALFECTANLVISIILIHYIGIVGVAIGTIAPNVLMAIFFNVPEGCRFSSITIKEFFKQAIWRTLWIGALTAGLTHLVSLVFFPDNFLQLLISFVISGSIYLVLYFLFGIYGWERKQFLGFVKRKLNLA